MIPPQQRIPRRNEKSLRVINATSDRPTNRRNDSRSFSAYVMVTSKQTDCFMDGAPLEQFESDKG